MDLSVFTLLLVSLVSMSYQGSILETQGTSNDRLPSLTQRDEQMVSHLLSKLLSDPDFMGSNSKPQSEEPKSSQDPITARSEVIFRNPFEGIVVADGRDALLSGFAEIFQKLTSSFIDNVVKSSHYSHGENNHYSNQFNNEVSSIGSNTIGVGEGDIPHRPVSANAKPTGVEPPRPEKNPNVSQISKVPSSVVNQTINGVQSPGTAGKTLKNLD